MKAIEYAMMLKPGLNKVAIVRSHCPNGLTFTTGVANLCSGEGAVITRTPALCKACWNQEMPTPAGEKEMPKTVKKNLWEAIHKEATRAFKEVLNEAPLVVTLIEKQKQEPEIALSEKELEEHIQKLVDSLTPELVPYNLTIEQRLDSLFRYLNYFDRRSTSDAGKIKMVQSEIEKLLFTKREGK